MGILLNFNIRMFGQLKAMMPSMRKWQVLLYSQQWKVHGIDKAAYRNLACAYDWKNLVRAFDLRYWYIGMGVNRGQGTKYSVEIEDIHNELNYMHVRSQWMRNGFWFSLLMGLWLAYAYETEEENKDWVDKFDEKYRLQMYSELDEGGLE